MTILKRSMKAVFFFLTAALLAGLCMLSAGAVSIGGGTVQGTDLNFRTEASLSSASQGFATTGDTVIITGIEGDWYSVLFKGKKGYMFAEYVAPSQIVELNAPMSALVSANTVRIRDGAGYTSNTLTYVDAGTPLTVLAVNDCWLKVKLENELVGYIFSDYVSFDGTVPTSAKTEAQTIGETIVEYAKQYMGTSYVYGGSSPSGFDCSGFVSYVLKNNGYDPTRTSYTLYDQYPHIEKSELRIGDLVFFSSYSSWGSAHVGIYIGNNEFIHSSSGCGYVTINNLDDTYYAAHYYGAGRYIE